MDARGSGDLPDAELLAGFLHFHFHDHFFVIGRERSTECNPVLGFPGSLNHIAAPQDHLQRQAHPADIHGKCRVKGGGSDDDASRVGEASARVDDLDRGHPAVATTALAMAPVPLPEMRTTGGSV